MPSLRIIRGVLQILKVYQNRSFKTFVSKVHVWPLRGAALVETGLPRRGCHSCHLPMNLSKFFSHLVSHLENERPALSTPQDYNEIQNETLLQTCSVNQQVLWESDNHVILPIGFWQSEHCVRAELGEGVARSISFDYIMTDSPPWWMCLRSCHWSPPIYLVLNRKTIAWSVAKRG